ncbi:alpha/beta hydrolase [Pseudonocardia sp. C8]|nr:alpha/beta hydrolase [Pseudonocardia sp. C8]MBC3193149.1 alpha/beta hydrolase [Pseudonocardia sp. C8]
MARAVVAQHGGIVERPLDGGRTLPLAWVRARGGDRTPIVAIPGGPGLASVLPYRGLRTAAARRGLDLIMVEHRGIGLSRRDTAGADLRAGDVTTTAAADDLAAVLDANGVRRAVVYGTSYGSYLAQVFGARHPDRVAAMVLDSPCLDRGDVAEVRAHLRARYWEGRSADPAVRRCAEHVRALAAAGADPRELTEVVQHVAEFAGPVPLERLLAARRRGAGGRAWSRIARIGRAEVAGAGRPMVYEPDLVRPIGQVEMGYAAEPDGGVLDPQRIFARAPAVTGDRRVPPYDLAVELPRFTWPVAVVSGERDLRTPRPVAARIAGLAPDGVLVGLDGLGHSALDTHPVAALNVAHVVEAGGHAALPGLAPRLTALPRRGASWLLGPLLAAAIRVDTLLPGPRCPSTDASGPDGPHRAAPDGSRPPDTPGPATTIR